MVKLERKDSSFLHPYPHSFELTRTFATKTASRLQEDLWAKLVVWLKNRYTF